MIPLYHLWDHPADLVTEGPAQWLSPSLPALEGFPVSGGTGHYSSWQWGASSKVKPLLISGSICRAWIPYSRWPARDGTFYTQGPWWTIPPWIMLCNITPDHETCKGGSIAGSECLLFWRSNCHLLKVPNSFSSCHSSVRLIQFWPVMSLLVLAITSLHMYIIIRSC